jgi:hypothetical protein
LLYKIKQRELKSERAREEAREAIESATLQSHPAPVREGLLELENSFGGAPSSVHATQHRHYSRVRRAKAYRMLASQGHLGVAALTTLEISLDQQNLAQTCTAAAQIVRALKFNKQLSQFILPPCSSFSIVSNHRSFRERVSVQSFTSAGFVRCCSSWPRSLAKRVMLMNK